MTPEQLLERLLERRREVRAMLVSRLWSQLAANGDEFGESRPTHEREFSLLTHLITLVKRRA